MTKKYSTKRALVASLLALVICFSLLVGTTFAWFTDSVTSSGNIIKAGNLEVAMHWADGTEAVPAEDSEDWIDASSGAIFDYSLWEPGFVQVRHIKISNVGNLAFKYKVNIVANGEVTDLTDVIDVYYADPAVQVADRTALTEDKKLGTLSQVLAGLAESGNGVLLADAEDTITIAFKMQETADNNYKNKAIGSDFSIQILATQYTAEDDSFDNQYDKDAIYLGPDGSVFADTSWYTMAPSAAEYTLTDVYQLLGLAEIVNSGVEFNATVKLDSDINIADIPWTPIGSDDYAFNGTFDGCGYTIEGLNATSTGDAAFFHTLDEDATVKNVNFENVNIKAKNAGVVAINAGGSTIENVHVLSGTVEGTSYSAAFVGRQAFSGATIKNCTNYADVTSGFVAAGFGGYIWYDSVVEECVNYGDVIGGDRAGGIAAHIGGTVKNCENNGEIISKGAMPAGGIAASISGVSTFEGCVNNGNVTNEGTDAYNSLAGGIVGVTPGSAVTLKNCVNNGNITANASDAAGIASSHYGVVTAIECENNGDVYGATGAVGIVAATGMFSGTNTVTDCVNNGSVTEG